MSVFDVGGGGNNSEETRLEARFRRFHAENPHVYEGLVKLARQAVAKGRRKMGARMLYEVMRWYWFLETTDDSDFKLNDNYISRYARLIMKKESDLEGIFELRALKS